MYLQNFKTLLLHSGAMLLRHHANKSSQKETQLELQSGEKQ